MQGSSQWSFLYCLITVYPGRKNYYWKILVIIVFVYIFFHYFLAWIQDTCVKFNKSAVYEKAWCREIMSARLFQQEHRQHSNRVTSCCWRVLRQRTLIRSIQRMHYLAYVARESRLMPFPSRFMKSPRKTPSVQAVVSQTLSVNHRYAGDT
jgi:hypothetical protein